MYPHRAGSSNVVPILGPLTFQEAGRQIPEAPEAVRARVWERIQERIGGGGPGSRPPAPGTPAPRLLAKPAAVAMLAGLGGMAVGVLVGPAWNPFHRPAPAPAIVQVMTAPSTVAPPPPEAPPPPAAAEAASSEASDRDVVWIAVLIRAGRTAEARQHLMSFARAYPRSPRLDDFRRTLGTP